MDMLNHNHAPAFTAQVCGYMAILCSLNLNEQQALGFAANTELGHCISEQRVYIMQYGMDMIRGGYQPQFAAQVCASMVSLIQREALGPLAGWTPDQQGYILRYGMDMIRGGNEPELAAHVCASITILYTNAQKTPLERPPNQETYNFYTFIKQYEKAMITPGRNQTLVTQVCMSMVGLIQREALGPLAGCTPDQQGYIIRYGMDMIRDGNEPELAAQVCASMVVLYENGIEVHIPEQITIEDNRSSDAIRRSVKDPNSVVFAPQFIAQRAVATKYFIDVMAANGANCEIISSYLKAQRYSSWHQKCLVMKYFLLQQRKRGTDATDRYYFEGNKRTTQQISLSTLIARYNTYFQSQGSLNDDLLNQYTTTVAMYKAYTAIALRRTQFLGKNPPQRTCQLQRAMGRAKLIDSYPGSAQQPAYASIQQGGTFSGIKGGIADSAALGSPVYHFAEPEKGNDRHEMPVPFLNSCCIFHIL
jgi:hypothetical protein